MSGETARRSKLLSSIRTIASLRISFCMPGISQYSVIQISSHILSITCFCLMWFGVAKAAQGQTPESRPDFSGQWIPFWGDKSEIPEGLTYDELHMFNIPKADLTPEYKKKTEETVAIQNSAGTEAGAGKAAANRIAVVRQAYCLPFGMPRMMVWQTALDIFQDHDRIVIVGEVNRELRRIWLEREQIPLDEVHLGWWGRSVGRWEGRTLVVNTIGIKAEVDAENYMAHSDQMEINEHIYLYRHDVLYDDITITDPLALKSPLSYRAIWMRAPKDLEPTEFVCDEFRSRVTEDGRVIHHFNN